MDDKSKSKVDSNDYVQPRLHFGSKNKEKGKEIWGVMSLFF